MVTVRCYVPLSADELARLQAERRLDGPRPGYAVTGPVREERAAGDQEEWEYAALQEAAQALRAQGAPVVLAAVDLTADQVDASRPEGARVQVGDVDLPRVAALHVGDDVVTGDPQALDGQHEELELSWYDTTEIAHVVDLARACPTTSDPSQPDQPGAD